MFFILIYYVIFLDEESNLLKWYNKEDLKNAYNIQHNILTMANEALEVLGER